jgi:uncharacterized protein YbaR (Trm112 family)
MSADSPQTEFQSRFAELCAMLACPACQGDLGLESERVVCERCGLVYPIVDGIPVLIPRE